MLHLLLAMPPLPPSRSPPPPPLIEIDLRDMLHLLLAMPPPLPSRPPPPPPLIEIDLRKMLHLLRAICIEYLRLDAMIFVYHTHTHTHFHTHTHCWQYAWNASEWTQCHGTLPRRLPSHPRNTQCLLDPPSAGISLSLYSLLTLSPDSTSTSPYTSYALF
jgi:hypothetical protein